MRAQILPSAGGLIWIIIYRNFCEDSGSGANATLFSLPDFQNTQGIIFVVDSNDRERVSEAREELQRMLNEDELRDALLLVFANKQDLPNAMNAAEITDKLGLHSLRQRQW